MLIALCFSTVAIDFLCRMQKSVLWIRIKSDPGGQKDPKKEKKLIKTIDPDLNQDPYLDQDLNVSRVT